VENVDVVLYLIEPGIRRDETGLHAEIGEANRFILEKLKRVGKPVLLGINKIDIMPNKQELLPVIARWKDEYPFVAVFPLSAAEGEGTDELIELIGQQLPEGPPLFPTDMLTDAAERYLVGEYVREQILRFARQEVPYSAAVVVDEFDESERESRHLVRIFARIYVERDAQKAILIGRQGRKLNAIRVAARRHIEGATCGKIYVDHWVKVAKDWRQDVHWLRRFGSA
jgi:GTP-binding protein Era